MKQTMKMKMIKSAIAFTLIFLSGNMAMAQCKEYKWPENKAKAEELAKRIGDSTQAAIEAGINAVVETPAVDSAAVATETAAPAAEAHH